MTNSPGKEVEEKILAAAYSVFLKKGKAGTRMQEIADKAGVNKALLYYYFRSKNNLYKAVFKQVVEKFILSIFQNLNFSLGFKEILKDFIFSHIKTIKDNKQVFKFFFSEVWMNSREVMEIFKNTLNIRDKPVYALFYERMEKAVAEKEIREIDPFQLHVNILSLDIFFFIISPIVFKVSGLSPIEQEKVIRDREEEVFNFVWESIRLRKEE